MVTKRVYRIVNVLLIVEVVGVCWHFMLTGLDNFRRVNINLYMGLGDVK